MDTLSRKTAAAMKWSSIAEVATKLIAPVTNMILARILAPESFGVLATVTMVISFAEVFVESGFQKFLIQHRFSSEDEERRYMSVAFWANLMFSMIIWGGLIVFRHQVARLAGNAELGNVIGITGVMIPVYGIVGIQNCKLKKDLQFRNLFFIRLIAACVPLLVTIPLALIGLDYWALIIGNIAGVLFRSLSLHLMGGFRPDRYFGFSELFHMFRSGIWTLLDGIAVWLTSWIDMLLIGSFMSDYHLGLYKNSVSTITALFTMVTSAIVPVLFSSLSALQHDDDAFANMFLKVQKFACMLLLPIGVGIFLYRDLATYVLFGEKWSEAADIIGIMSLMTVIRTIFVSLYSDVYRAKGKFRVPLFMQVADMLVLIPACVLSAQQGFWALVYTRAFVKIDMVVPNLIVASRIGGIPFKRTLTNLKSIVLATICMTLVAMPLQTVSGSIGWTLLSIVICSVVYFAVLFAFQRERKELLLPAIRYIKQKTMRKG